MDPKLPQNPTALLMQAQERKNLVQKLINLKPTVDKREPKKYNHLNSGRIQNRNKEVQKINSENQQMLGKIMKIMKRKPKGNGLDGVALKQNNSNADLDEVADHQESFQGNADISLIQSNVENTIGQSRFSFEISPNLPQNRSVRPFGEQRKSNVDTQVQSTTRQESVSSTPGATTQNQNRDSTVLAQEMNIEESDAQKEETDIAASSRNPFSTSDPKKISPSQSADIYNKGIAASAMFDQNIPANESDMKLLDNDQNMIQANQPGDKISFTNQRIDKVAQKRLYPGQVTLNHIVRKKEVQRINRENMVMLKALNNVKPSVQRTVDQQRLYVKQEQYKRNMSKFRNVGKSQPRPRVVRDLDAQGLAFPDIPRVGSSTNKSELKSILPDVKQREVGHLRQRRTSQGNRHSWITNNLLQAPNSQRTNTRNQRVVYNSNQSISEYNSAIEQPENNYKNRAMSSNPDNTTALTQSFMPGQHYGEQPPTISSIASSTVDGDTTVIRSKKRPSYLDHLKKSPLLSSMTRHQYFPKSIVNRVLSQREQAEKEAFKRYGIVMKPTMSVSLEKPTGFLPNTSISHNSVQSNHQVHRRTVLTTDPQRPRRTIDKQPSQDKQIDVVLSTNGSKKSGVVAYTGDYAKKAESSLQESGQDNRPTQGDGASLEPIELEEKPQNLTTFGRNHSFQAISEEQVSQAVDGNKATTLDPHPVTITNESDDYSGFTPSASIVPSEQQTQQQPNILFSGDAIAIDEQGSPELPVKKSESLQDLKVVDPAPIQQREAAEKKPAASAVALNEEAVLKEQSKPETAVNFWSNIQSRTKTKSQKFSLPADQNSANDNKFETYSLPQESMQESNDKGKRELSQGPSLAEEVSQEYSNEEFEEIAETPQLNKSSTVAKPATTSNEGEYISDEFAEITPNHPISNESIVERQGTNEIEDESFVQRQGTNEIEDMTETGKVGQNSAKSIYETKSDKVSAKTIQNSKSQQASAYGIIEKRKTESIGIEHGRTNTNLGLGQQVARLGVETPEIPQSQGTGFGGTEHVSRVGTAAKIIQSKENIILSELSSKNTNNQME